VSIAEEQQEIQEINFKTETVQLDILPGLSASFG